MNMSISSVGTSFQGFDDLWGANVYDFSFRSIYFTIPANLKAIFILHPVTSSYLWILLLLSGAIELNPEPANQLNYTLSHPNLCGFHRTALYFVFKCIKLVPRKDDKGIEIYDVSPDESINDVKSIFNNRFNMSELDFVKFHKHKDRFLSIIAKWGKNRGREDKE